MGIGDQRPPRFGDGFEAEERSNWKPLQDLNDQIERENGREHAALTPYAPSSALVVVHLSVCVDRDS